jgi:hypothetical protein
LAGPQQSAASAPATQCNRPPTASGRDLDGPSLQYIVNPLHSISVTQVRAGLNWFGAMVLVAGLGSAVLIWRAQDRIDRENEAAQSADASAPLSPLDSRKQMRDVEMYYGKVGVLEEEAEELLHGKPLAKTIGVISVLTAAGLFLVAARLGE